MLQPPASLELYAINKLAPACAYFLQQIAFPKPMNRAENFHKSRYRHPRAGIGGALRAKNVGPDLPPFGHQTVDYARMVALVICGALENRRQKIGREKL
jgi:hypothetical protein